MLGIVLGARDTIVIERKKNFAIVECTAYKAETNKSTAGN